MSFLQQGPGLTEGPALGCQVGAHRRDKAEKYEKGAQGAVRAQRKPGCR